MVLCKLVIDRFEKEQTYYTEGELAEKINLPLVVVRTMLAEAVDCGLLQRVDIEEYSEFVFAPGLPTDRFTVVAAWSLLDNAGLNELQNVELAEFAAIDSDLQSFDELLENAAGNRLLREI